MLNKYVQRSSIAHDVAPYTREVYITVQQCEHLWGQLAFPYLLPFWYVGVRAILRGIPDAEIWYAGCNLLGKIDSVAVNWKVKIV